MTPMECVRTTAAPIHTLGAQFMFHADTVAMGAERGLDGLVFYAVGRGGVLGDVSADVIAAAFGFFDEGFVRHVWNGKGADAPRAETAAAYADAAAHWGRANLSGLDDLGRTAGLLEKVIDAAPVAGLSLFAGWRSVPRPDDDAGRVGLALHVLREHRGSAHLLAVLAEGLTPLQAAAADGPDRVKMMGFRVDPPDVSGVAEAYDRAEELTDRLTLPAYGALGDDERAALASGVAAAYATLS